MKHKLIAMAAIALASAGACTTHAGRTAEARAKRSGLFDIGAGGMPAGWTDDFDAAKARAEKEGKLILVDFAGSDWNFWSHGRDWECLARKEFVEAAQKDFVLLYVDSPKDKSKLSAKARKQNPMLLEKYGIGYYGMATVMVLDAKGNRICKVGYRKGGPVPNLAALAETKRAIDAGEDLAKKEREHEEAVREKRAAVVETLKKHWTEDFDYALGLAEMSGKCLFVYFSEWERNGFFHRSRELEEKVFSNEEFLEAAEKEYILVKIDVLPKQDEYIENFTEEKKQQNLNLAKKYDIGNSRPAVLFVDASGKALYKCNALYLDEGPVKYLRKLEAEMREYIFIENRRRGGRAR